MPEKTTKPKPIPVTLLSGFLGSGKTTLLEKILTTEHGFKIAVIINDVSSINIDATLIQNHRVTQKEEKLIQLQNGCICCTLRGDLLEELAQLAFSNEFQYIVIESTGISEPMQVAETFTTEFSQILLQDHDQLNKEEQQSLERVVAIGGLSKVVQLDTCVTVIDAINFLGEFETTDFLNDRFGDNGQGETERTITDLMIDQIEFADVIIINKVKGIKKRKQRKISKIIKTLNPVAKVLSADYCDVSIDEVVNTGLFDFEKSSTSAGWLHSINEMSVRGGFGTASKASLTPKPESEEYRINNFVYRSRLPFHPERLYRVLRDKFIVIEQAGFDDDEQNESVGIEYGEDEEEEEDEGEEDEEEEKEEEEEEEKEEEDNFVQPTDKQLIKNKKRSPFGPMLRSKGYFWLASRYIMRGEWSTAGAMMTLKGGIPWFAVTGPEFFPEGTKELIEKDMEGQYGDRRNELVFIGVEIDKVALTKLLDSCLVTEEEFATFQDVVSRGENLFRIEKSLQVAFNDGFADWISFEDDEGASGDSIEAKMAQEASHGHSHRKH